LFARRIFGLSEGKMQLDRVPIDRCRHQYLLRG
jgi:hypothetical protein